MLRLRGRRQGREEIGLEAVRRPSTSTGPRLSEWPRTAQRMLLHRKPVRQCFKDSFTSSVPDGVSLVFPHALSIVVGQILYDAWKQYPGNEESTHPPHETTLYVLCMGEDEDDEGSMADGEEES
jgi:hypothetical protein